MSYVDRCYSFVNTTLEESERFAKQMLPMICLDPRVKTAEVVTAESMDDENFVMMLVVECTEEAAIDLDQAFNEPDALL